MSRPLPHPRAVPSERPLVSIIIPSYNQGRFLGATLESILAQDYRPLEVVVVDGASTDNTVEVLRQYEHHEELTWTSEPDNGVVEAVNKGLARASGEIIGIQSSDDTYLPGAVSAAMTYLSAHPDVALVYGDVELMDEQSRVLGRDEPEAFDLRRYIGRFSYIPQPTAFVRAEVARLVGGWRSNVSYAADADFWLRVVLGHRAVKLDRLMGRYRYHDCQRDKQRQRIAQDWECMVRDILTDSRLDRATRRYARMGVHLARYRYAPESAWLRRTIDLYRAVLANPGAVVDSKFPKRELLFGREPVWKLLSRIKRGLGFSPRGA